MSKILIVEDDFALSDAFSMILEHGGHSVLVAKHGQQALDVLHDETPDLILLDVLMPVMDGREFLKEFNNTHCIPVVVLSNLDAKTDIKHLIDLGATTYTLKASIAPGSLLELVKETIAKHPIKTAR